MARQGYSKETERALIFTLRFEGRTWDQIEAHPLVTLKRSAIKRWARRGDAGGLNNLHTRPKTGRPRVTTREEDADLVASVEASKQIAVTTVVRQLLPHFPGSMKTAQRRVNAAGLHCRTPAYKPKLTDEHKAKRLQFAYKNIHQQMAYWQDTFWSDEKTWRSDENGRISLWRRPGTRYEAENVVEKSRSGHVQAGFWGCVSGRDGAVVLTPPPPRMNAAGYINILRDTFLPAARELRPGARIRFMQDNAGIHTAHRTMDFLAAQPDVDVIYWPPNSPDLNVIEHVWAQSVNEWEPRHERNQLALQQHVQDVWRLWQGNPQKITNLVNSIPARLQAVIDANGGHTSY